MVKGSETSAKRNADVSEQEHRVASRKLTGRPWRARQRIDWYGNRQRSTKLQPPRLEDGEPSQKSVQQNDRKQLSINNNATASRV